MNKIVYLYVLDTMADWEPALLIAELNTGRTFRKNVEKYTVKTVGLTKDPIVTMGNVRILPDMSIDECKPDASLLILPGGETWLEDIHNPLIEKVREFLDADIPVAAICGATMALAKAGLMNNIPHTSNDLEYLKAVCPTYAGEKFYRPEPAVTGDNLITASGIAPVEFAREALKKLDVFSPKTLEAWYQLYTTHEPQYFYELMGSLEE